MTAVLFAARLRISASHTKLDAQQETGAGETSAAGTSAAGTSAAGTSAADTSAADTSAAERAPGERTWKQKRKDAYLRTHHAPPPPPAAAEVSIAAISFAAKLKSRSLAPPASSGGDKTFAQKRKVGLDYR